MQGTIIRRIATSSRARQSNTHELDSVIGEIRQLDRNLHFVGDRFELRRKDGSHVAEMEGAESYYTDGEFWVDGFVPLDTEGDSWTISSKLEPSGLYRREHWSVRL